MEPGSFWLCLVTGQEVMGTNEGEVDYPVVP